MFEDRVREELRNLEWREFVVVFRLFHLMEAKIKSILRMTTFESKGTVLCSSVMRVIVLS